MTITEKEMRSVNGAGTFRFKEKLTCGITGRSADPDPTGDTGHTGSVVPCWL